MEAVVVGGGVADVGAGAAAGACWGAGCDRVDHMPPITPSPSTATRIEAPRPISQLVFMAVLRW
ncbi:hypothetical protein CGZ98_03700 [Enemella evansiae]|nr:hypothetical protein CGZ98_03700 [Enemella evansiae]